MLAQGIFIELYFLPVEVFRTLRPSGFTLLYVTFTIGYGKDLKIRCKHIWNIMWVSGDSVLWQSYFLLTLRRS